MINKAIILGNVGSDPEIRTLGSSGDKVANFSVATSEQWKDKSGQKQERTEWHKVSAFGPVVGVIERFVSKGTKVYIEGQIQTRKWTDQSGADRYSTEIVLRGPQSTIKLLDGAQGGTQQGNRPPMEGKPREDFSFDDTDGVPF